jgi:hypothetical protein
MAYDANTKLLVHFNGADAANTYTAETGQTVTFAAQAQLDTAQQKFGSASLLLDGNADYVSVPDSADWAFGTNPFTLECWVRFNSISNAGLFEQRNSANSNEMLTFMYESADTLAVAIRSAAVYTLIFRCPFDPSTNTWYHLALVRVNSDNAATGWRIFVDGVAQSLTLHNGAWNASVPNMTGAMVIGGSTNFSYWLNGWLDEARISNTARWTSDFSVPTSEYAEEQVGGFLTTNKGWM